tara:strand:- start:9654 stop:11225 length:1572 start_codon:yes stop_codon:yes gene_type:complete
MALANKYRPNSFSEVIGQENAVIALRNIIKNQSFHNGYIFSGTRGVGKTTLGRLFAKALNCINYDAKKGETCNVCNNCKEIQKNSHLDLIEIDAASRTGVDDMRELLDSVQYRPSQGKYKVYLIDEVHMLSPQSFNAMLKTLEEPPGHVIFMLATTEANKIPKTIVSRCLQFNLKLVSDELIAGNLKRVFINEEVTTDDKSIDLLVELAKGSVRDSLTLADQAISHCDGNLTEPEISKLHGVLDISSTTKLFEAIFSNSVDGVVNEIKRYKSLDVNYDILFDRALSFLHTNMVDNVLSDEESNQDLHLYYQFFTNGLIDAKQTGNKRDCFDIAVLRCLTFAEQSENKVKKKPKLVKKIEPKLTATKKEPQKKESLEKPIEPLKDVSPKKNGIKLSPDNWLELFDRLDLSGPSRAFFSNLQLQKVEKKTLFFSGTDLFAARINEGDSVNLIESLNRLGHEDYSVEVESSETVKNTPSQEWVKNRNKDIEEFRKEIISSELIMNLKENFGEEITEDKITIIDHEE